MGGRGKMNEAKIGEEETSEISKQEPQLHTCLPDRY